MPWAPGAGQWDGQPASSWAEEGHGDPTMPTWKGRTYSPRLRTQGRDPPGKKGATLGPFSAILGCLCLPSSQDHGGKECEASTAVPSTLGALGASLRQKPQLLGFMLIYWGIEEEAV